MQPIKCSHAGYGTSDMPCYWCWGKGVITAHDLLRVFFAAAKKHD